MADCIKSRSSWYWRLLVRRQGRCGATRTRWRLTARLTLDYTDGVDADHARAIELEPGYADEFDD